jgi:lipopolysaccharide export system permease protein
MFPGKFTRYILWDVLKMFALMLIAMTMVISLVFVGQKLVSEGLGYLAVAKLLPYIFLIALQFSVPATLLFAVCCVYGRVSADNEIIALKSAGVSPNRVFRPAIALGFALSVPSVWLNDIAVSWARPAMQQVILRSIEEVVYLGLSATRSYNSDKGFSIHVQSVQDKWLIKPNIWMYSNNQLRTISAERARISIHPESDKLEIELQDSFFDIGGSNQISWPGSHTIEMPLDVASRNGSTNASPSQYSISQIPGELASQNALNERRRERLATRFSVALASGRYSELQDFTTQSLIAELADTERRLARLKTEPMRRWALGFSCLAFVWMGVPMAVLIRSADYWWTFGVCFIPVLLVYYPIFGLALEFSKDGTWPAVSLWLGNVTLALIGSWLMRAVVKT